jgi:excisionase family DNA binding protein
MPNLLTIKDVCERLQVRKTTVYKWIREDQTFPKQVRLGPRVVRWDEDQLGAWIRTRIVNTGK